MEPWTYTYKIGIFFFLQLSTSLSLYFLLFLFSVYSTIQRIFSTLRMRPLWCIAKSSAAFRPVNSIVLILNSFRKTGHCIFCNTLLQYKCVLNWPFCSGLFLCLIFFKHFFNIRFRCRTGYVSISNVRNVLRTCNTDSKNRSVSVPERETIVVSHWLVLLSSVLFKPSFNAH